MQARPKRGTHLIIRGLLAAAALTVLIGGCPPTIPGGANEPNQPIFHNTTDPTNDGASYVGSAACSACHPKISEMMRTHGHVHALTLIEGQPPEYAAEGTRAGVPNPPAGSTWNDISYVISGYLHGAFFVDAQGFVMTTGIDGADTQYNLDYPPNGTTAGFVPYLPAQATPKPFDYETCFRCHTTGPMPQDPNNPRSQGNRPGILGTWAEENVQCEACHGPGSNHVPNPQRRNIFVDSTPTATCARCHTEGDDPNVIVAKSGFLNGNTQYPQLLASGGHADFNCTICHNPHVSITYDREDGLRNGCTACHTDVNLAFHANVTYELGTYREEVTCESCHMPLLALSNSTAPDVGGTTARIGDVRGHIFRIDPDSADYRDMLTADESRALKDADGQLAATLDYVCLRCHNGTGNAFTLTPDGATAIAPGMHER